MDTPRIAARTVRRITALLAIVALAATGVACSGDDSTDAPAAVPRTTTAAGATAAGGAAASDGVTVAIGDDAAGKHLAGPTGHALYFFASDATGVSNCTGGCAGNWPPLTVATGATPSAADEVTGALAVIERADGGRQVTLGGRPLYYFAGDSAAGQINGDGVGGVWSLARPGSASASPGSSSGSSSIAPVNATASTGYGY